METLLPTVRSPHHVSSLMGLVLSSLFESKGAVSEKIVVGLVEIVSPTASRAVNVAVLKLSENRGNPLVFISLAYGPDKGEVCRRVRVNCCRVAGCAGLNIPNIFLFLIGVADEFEDFAVAVLGETIRFPTRVTGVHKLNPVFVEDIHPFNESNDGVLPF
jgi:hypothetical protein